MNTHSASHYRVSTEIKVLCNGYQGDRAEVTEHSDSAETVSNLIQLNLHV